MLISSVEEEEDRFKNCTYKLDRSRDECNHQCVADIFVNSLAIYNLVCEFKIVIVSYQYYLRCVIKGRRPTFQSFFVHIYTVFSRMMKQQMASTVIITI